MTKNNLKINKKDLFMKAKFTILKITLLVIMLSLSFTTKSLSQVPQPCTPDCPNDSFITQPPLIVNYGLNCTLVIWYATRIACGTWYDVQLLMVQTIGTGCGVLFPPDQLFKRAYYKLIEADPMGFPPRPTDPIPDPPGYICNEQWRVSQASCWTYYNVTVNGQSHLVTIPCNGTDCCLQRMNICRWVGGSVTINPIGDPSPVNDCSHSTPPIPPAPPGSLCEAKCNWFLVNSIEKSDPNEGIVIKNNQNLTDIEKPLFINDDNLTISINSRNTGFYKIKISNAYGNFLKEIDGELSVGLNDINVNLQNLKNDNYVYSIEVNNSQILTGKFSLIK